MDIAFSVFEMMKKENVRLTIANYNCLIQVCTRSKNAERLPDIIADIKAAGLEFDRHTYNAIVELHTVTDNIPAAVDMVMEMLNQESFPLTSTDTTLVAHVLRTCGKNNMLDSALKLYDRARQIPALHPNVVVMSALLFACGKHGQTKRAMEIFEEMVELSNFVGRDGMPVHDVKPNVITYTTLIQVLAENGEPLKALQVFRRMKDEGVYPNVLTYNAVLLACASAEATRRVTSEVLRGIHERRLTPNHITLHSVLAALTRSDPALIRAKFSVDPSVSEESKEEGAGDEEIEGQAGNESGNEEDKEKPQERGVQPDAESSTDAKESHDSVNTTRFATSGPHEDIDLEYALEQMRRMSSRHRLPPSATAYYILLDASLRSGTTKDLMIGSELVEEARQRVAHRAGPQLVELMEKVEAVSEAKLREGEQHHHASGAEISADREVGREQAAVQ